jgi:hypothetical protein
MNFKTKIAYTAVLATLGMAAGSAQAAYLSEVGTGQVLLYPYYTVQGGYDTYVSVVNTTSRAKAVKVRFIEAKASAEVLDFNLYLSKYDVWAAAITATTDGAKLVTTDTSCTAPQITGAVSFRNGAYVNGGTTLLDDILEDGLSRTREGYIEMIEMGVPDNTANVNFTNPLLPLTFEQSVTHKAATRMPADCAWVSAQWAPVGSGGAAPSTLRTAAPSGGLIGSATLINVAAGTDYTYDPVVIDDYSAVAQHSRPGDLQPNLGNAGRTSVVMRRNTTTGAREVVQSTWPTGREAISAVLSHSNVMNEYSVEAAISSGTDWVVTFPTKNLHVNRFTDLNQDVTTTPAPPFTMKARTATNGTTWLACEPVSLTIYDREEQTPNSVVDFSPQPVTGNSLCFEANVITFSNSSVLASSLVPLNVTTAFTSGWMNLGFNGTNQSLTNTNNTTFNAGTATTATYYGLPAVGFAVEKYVNGNVGGVLSNYGGSFIHKYVQTITTP